MIDNHDMTILLEHYQPFNHVWLLIKVVLAIQMNSQAQRASKIT
jgi:hypothetical protein